MTGYQGPERRKSPRMAVNFVVSYRIEDAADSFDLSQTKDLSQGGMLLTTNKPFEAGTRLLMILRFPLVPQKIEVTGIVVGSREVVRDIIYETRIQFLNIDQEFFNKLGEFIKEHLSHD
jgi:Tfp pilus assembly protein PilZ